MNRDEFDPGPLADVEHVRDGARSTLVFRRRLRHSPAEVWRALTDAKELPQWAPFQPDRSLAQTGPATLRMSDGTTNEEFPSVVRAAVEPRLLEYTWGDDVLRWELEPDGTGTLLTLRHTVESPDWIPRVAAGWHLCLAVAERLLDGNPIGPIVGAEAMKYGWEKLHDEYRARMGMYL
jgi:uncharacterized protein YndB with AHSA1/START domain